jgi:hypothetical protein
MEKCGVRGLALSLNVKQSNGHAIPIALWNQGRVRYRLPMRSCDLEIALRDGQVIDRYDLIVAYW